MNSKVALAAALAAFFCLQGIVFSSDQVCDEDLLLTPSRSPIERSKTGRWVTLEEKDFLPVGADAADLIETVEGVRVKRAGYQSGLTSIRLRGARSFDTKLMVDGFELRDPSDTQGSANSVITDIPSFGIKSAEVLRGPASALHGSSSIGGAVNFETGAPNGFSILSEYGAGNTFREGISYGSENHSVSLGRRDSEGFDAHDGYEQSSVQGKSLFEIGEQEIALSYLASRADAALDSAPFVTRGNLQTQQDDENDTTERSLFHGGASIQGPIFDGIGYRIKAATTSTDRRFTFLPDADGSGFLSDGAFRGLDMRVSEELNFEHSEIFTTTIGHEHTREFLGQKVYSTLPDNLEDHSDQWANDFFLEENVRLGRSTTTLALRENTHESAKGRLTWDAATSYILPDFTVLRAHAGTAYREPSLFELDGAFLTSFGTFEVGNPNLSPERASGWDLGVERPMGPLTLGTNYFRWDRTNAIDFIGGAYKNAPSAARAWGLESFGEFKKGDWRVRLSQTHTEAEGLQEIPSNQYGAEASLKAGKWRFLASAIFIGSRQAVIFNNDTFRLDRATEGSYLEVGAAAYYEVNKNFTIYARGENLTDEEHTDGGYSVPGARLYGGAIIRF